MGVVKGRPNPYLGRFRGTNGENCELNPPPPPKFGTGGGGPRGGGAPQEKNFGLENVRPPNKCSYLSKGSFFRRAISRKEGKKKDGKGWIGFFFLQQSQVKIPGDPNSENKRLRGFVYRKGGGGEKFAGRRLGGGVAEGGHRGGD